MAQKSKKNQLAKLKEEDPDFYSFVASKGMLDLSNNFDESDAEVDSDDEVDDNQLTNKTKKSGQGKLEESADSDETDEDEDNEEGYSDDESEEDDDSDVGEEEEEEQQQQQDNSIDETVDDEELEEEEDDDNDEDDDSNVEDEEGGSDFNGEEEQDVKETDLAVASGKRVVLTISMVEQWKEQLQGDNPEPAFRNVSAGLMAAIESIDCSETDQGGLGKFIVRSPNIYNQLVHVSLVHMAPALQRILNINNLAHLTASKKFKRYSLLIKGYLQTLVKLYDSTSETSQRAAVLRRGVLPLLAVFKVQPKQCRVFVKKMVSVWASGHPKLRVLVLIAIFRLVKMMGPELLDYTCKTMYLQYVQSCRFTTASSLGCICFMRLSLTELYSLDEALAYQHAFLYIRQMNFLLRNAIIASQDEKKQQTVNNWQFVHSLHLWCTLLGSTHPSKVLEPLIYPVVQLALGTIEMQGNGVRPIPLVLRVCSILTDLSASTAATFIPVLPILLRAFSNIIENKAVNKKRHLEKLPKWEFVLMLSQSEIGSNEALKDMARECALSIAQYLSVHAHNIAFPELVVPAVVMLKRCERQKEPVCQGLVKQLLARMKDHSEYIDNRRQDVNFQLKERRKVLDWETETKQQDRLPITVFYEKLQKQVQDARAQFVGTKKDDFQRERSKAFVKRKRQKTTGGGAGKGTKRKNTGKQQKGGPNKKQKKAPQHSIDTAIVHKAKEKVQSLSLDDL